MIDFQKIKSEAWDEWFNEVLPKIIKSTHEKSQFNLPKDLQDEVGQLKLIINYGLEISSLAVKNYHEALTAELKKHGIDLND